MDVRIHSEEWHSRIDYTRSIAVGASLIFTTHSNSCERSEPSMIDRDSHRSRDKLLQPFDCHCMSTCSSRRKTQRAVLYNLLLHGRADCERNLVSAPSSSCSCPRSLEILLQLHRDVCQKLNLITIPCGSSSLSFSSRYSIYESITPYYLAVGTTRCM